MGIFVLILGATLTIAGIVCWVCKRYVKELEYTTYEKLNTAEAVLGVIGWSLLILGIINFTEIGPIFDTDEYYNYNIDE